MSSNKAQLQYRAQDLYWPSSCVTHLHSPTFLESWGQPEQHLLPRATFPALQQSLTHQESLWICESSCSWRAALPWPERHLHPSQPWCAVTSPSSPAPSGNRSWRGTSSHTLGTNTEQSAGTPEQHPLHLLIISPKVLSASSNILS